MDAISVNGRYRVGHEVGYVCPFCASVKAGDPSVIHWYTMSNRRSASVQHHHGVSIHLIVPSTIQILDKKPM
jgi:hypothetical protein